MFQQNVSTVILGASNEKQLKENLNAMLSLKKYSIDVNIEVEKLLQNKPILPKF